PGHAVVGLGLGCGVLAGPPAVCPPRGGWTAARGIGGHIPDSPVWRCHRAGPPSLPAKGGRPPAPSAPVARRGCGPGRREPGEGLDGVRELERKRVWFAEALLSSTAVAVQQRLAQARHWAERLGKPVRLWMSEKQEAFVRGMAAEFPGGPHRYCANHCLRDVA